MKPKAVLNSIAVGAAAIALSIFYPFSGFAQSRGDASADQARQARIAELKARIAKLSQ